MYTSAFIKFCHFCYHDEILLALSPFTILSMFGHNHWPHSLNGIIKYCTFTVMKYCIFTVPKYCTFTVLKYCTFCLEILYFHCPEIPYFHCHEILCCHGHEILYCHYHEIFYFDCQANILPHTSAIQNIHNWAKTTTETTPVTEWINEQRHGEKKNDFSQL